MNQLSVTKPTCADLLKMAERELAAFFSAVTELFGSEQANLSAKDWLDELASINDLPASTREWRLLSVNVSARLASRVNAQKKPSMNCVAKLLANVRMKRGCSGESLPVKSQAMTVPRIGTDYCARPAATAALRGRS